MAMAKKGKVKNQHFVPRCLLRRFSQNDKTTSVFVVGTTTFVPTAGIKTQCAADYYYGQDQAIETELGRLESAFSRAIGDLSDDAIEGMTEADLSIVRAFVHVQAERTPHAAALHRMTYVEMGRQLWTAVAKANGLDSSDPGGEAERFADSQMPIPGAHTVELATKYQGSISDLQVKFVFGDGFMISDHPTLTLNLWRDAHPRFSRWPHLGGLLTKGFIYIMPVATKCAIVLYDRGTYRVGDDESRIAHASSFDQFALNGLQAVNASRLLFDTKVLMPVDLLGALDFRNTVRAAEGPGLLPLRPPDLDLSFLTITDRDSYDDWDLLMLPSRPGTTLPTPPRLDSPTAPGGG